MFSPANYVRLAIMQSLAEWDEGTITFFSNDEFRGMNVGRTINESTFTNEFRKY